MIKIARPPAPAFLSDKKKKWYKEIQKAIDHYTAAVPGAKAFEFDHYGDPLVKDELKKVFAKCAYCESHYRHVSDGDIEHFRPKGKVNEKNPQTPGYYWLANDWDNLLLSCMHCNQSRRHLLYKEDELKSRGKLDQFPLSDETKRLNRHDMTQVAFEEEEKVRLLINPCKENPEEHFSYDDTEGVIQGITDMGKTSIDVYVLQRHELVSERKQRLSQVLFQIARVKREYNRLNADQTKEQKDIFRLELDQLLVYTNANEPYAGMARFFIRRFFSQSGIL